jgi:hypothetical protein
VPHTPPTRRAVLGGLGATGLLGLAGCSALVPGTVRPNRDPRVVPEPLACEDSEVNRYPSGYGSDELSWGAADGFSLRVDGDSFEYGETARVSLRYTWPGSATIGNREKYNLETLTEAGWQELRSAAGLVTLTDLGFEKFTGQGWTWDIELTESGMEDATEADVTVCTALRPGRYRFVYWGLDGAVAVTFDLVRE